MHFLSQYSVNLDSKLSRVLMFKSLHLEKNKSLTSSSEKHLKSDWAVKLSFLYNLIYFT